MVDPGRRATEGIQGFWEPLWELRSRYEIPGLTVHVEIEGSYIRIILSRQPDACSGESSVRGSLGRPAETISTKKCAATSVVRDRQPHRASRPRRSGLADLQDYLRSNGVIASLQRLAAFLHSTTGRFCASLRS